MLMATMKDVAELANVGLGTVSRVINKKGGVKPSTLAKVNQAIKELNYVPDEYARGMKLNKTKTIALVVPTVWHPFFGEFAYYVEKFVSEMDYKLLLCNITNDTKESEYITMLKQNKVDGIISISYSPIDEYLSSDIPFVSIDRSFKDKNLATVSSDNEAGARLAAQTLIDKGGKVFAYIGAHNETENETKKRRIGFEQYIKFKGYPCFVLDVDEKATDVLKATEVFLNRYPEVDAIFTVNDFTALDVIALLEKMGKKVPEHVQIIGFDGIRMASERQYQLSTIRQPVKQLAQESVKMILNILNDQSHPNQIILPVEYIDGWSTR